jgi:hypothetical protein
MFKGLVAGLCSFLFGSSAMAQADSLKILFIGNSYTHMNDMPSIFKKIAVKAGQNVIVEKNTQSGASFHVHSERKDMYEAINRRKWDYVILQGFSRELATSKEIIDTATIPYVTKITDSIYANNPCTNVLFYMTWGYDNGFEEDEATNTFEKMADTIRNGYKYLGELFNVPVVPVGMVWKEVRGLNGIDLYADDRAHPSKNGSYLIASTFYSAIFNESLDRVFTSTISEKNATEIKKQMYKFIEQHREEYRLNENRFSVVTTTSKKGEFILDFTSSYPNATDIRWSFGDGTGYGYKSGKHFYKKAGTYKVQIEVTDSCGIRTHYKMVHFEPIKKPTPKAPVKPIVNKPTDRKI